MRILSIPTFNIQNNNYKNTQPTFEAGGKPITLQYILEKRSNLLPERVLQAVKAELAKGSSKTRSLLEIHRAIYEPILKYTSLEALKEDTAFPEFKDIKPFVLFERNTRYAKEFKERTDKNFVLNMIQEYWGNLKSKDEIAQSFGMKNRNSLEWALKQIDFVSFPPNYRTLLRSSDEAGNREIASKTSAWNALHPDLMYARNKHAAQGCKTEEYRKAQAQRMKEYDKEHPERREKISISGKESWAKCPEVRQAMSEFAAQSSSFLRHIVMKRFSGVKLTNKEDRISRGFFKRFWQTHPELKAVYAEAKKKK